MPHATTQRPPPHRLQIDGAQLRRRLFGLCIIWAGGCAAGAQAGPATPASSGPAVAAPFPVPHPPAQPWATLDHAERKAYMHEVIVPAMAPRFAAHDPERFADFSCRTCHGPNARARDYAMPSPHLPVLYPTGSVEQRTTVAQHRAMATFMYQQVTPTMRDALGQSSYDAATGQGFSCFRCHPRGEPAEPIIDGEPAEAPVPIETGQPPPAAALGETKP